MPFHNKIGLNSTFACRKKFGNKNKIPSDIRKPTTHVYRSGKCAVFFLFLVIFFGMFTAT